MIETESRVIAALALDTPWSSRCSVGCLVTNQSSSSGGRTIAVQIVVQIVMPHGRVMTS